MSTKSLISRNQQLSFPPAFAGFLLDLLLDPEGGGAMFPRNVGLPPKYMALQPKRLYSEF
jgi:hypothetical protein